MSGMNKLLTQFNRSLSLLTFKSFDSTTSDGRAKERYRRMIFSTLASAGAKVVSISTALISVPLTLHYLGAERYGMWMTISSFIAILSFADLGMGNGLLNRVAAAHGRGDRLAIRELVSSAFGVLTLIATMLMVAFFLSYQFVPWQKLFNVHNDLAQSEAGPAMAVFAVCFAAAIPSSIVQKVQLGLQSGFVVSMWQCCGSLLALAGVIVATSLHLGLPWLVLAFIGAPLIPATINSISFFLLSQRDIAPTAHAFSFTSARHIAQTGLLFLVLQVVAALSYSSDPLIISHVLGPSAVASYSVPERMFSVVGMIITMGLAPLWPAYGEAISREDHSWVRKTFFRSFITATTLAALGSLAVAVYGPTILRLWVGTAVHATPLLLIGLAVWKTIEAGANSVAMFLNGAHVVRFQVIVGTCTCAAILLLKFFLAGKIGISGTVWATVIGFSLFTAIPLLIRVRSIINASLWRAA